MEATIRLRFLGPIQVERGGEPVSGFESRKALALLGYLVARDQPIPREHLVDLFWGDKPEARGRANLSWVLSRIASRLPGCLEADRHTIQFQRSASCWLDLDAFEKLAAQGEAASLAATVELYRGEFLEGVRLEGCAEFEIWLVGEQEQWRQRAIEVLEKLVAYHSRRGEYEQGLNFARRLLALEPWREAVHRQVMQFLAWSGKRRAALAQYQACCRTLAEEWGVEPEEGTTQLYEQIRDGAPPERLIDLPPQPPSFLDEEALVRVERPVFVARERELAQLDEHLEGALGGQGQVVFVTGDAGQGKTALMHEFARRAQAAQPNLVVAGGNSNAHTGAGDPYLPFREILGLLTGDIQARWAAGAISREHARRLWHTLPLAVQALVEDGPDLIGTFVPGKALLRRAEACAPGPGGASWLDRLNELVERKTAVPGAASPQQINLFEQYTRMLAALARHAPLLLILDDLQWADTGSIGLLFHLGRQLVGNRILIVGAYRPAEMTLGRTPPLGPSLPAATEEGRERHPLVPVVNEFKRHFGDIEVKLGQAGDRSFIDAFLDTEPNRLGDVFRETLYRQTRGHPLFTIELLRGMQERRDLIQDGEGRWIEGLALNWGALPARVEAVIAERIGRLPETSREALTVASVEGETFTAEVVAQVQAADERKMVRRLSGELDRRHHLVRAQGVQRMGSRRLSRYQFRHILFQKYLYSSLDPVERAYLHEEVGAALERLHSEEMDEIAAVAGQLARHFAEAGIQEKAIDYLIQAGDAAARLRAHAEARLHYARAMEALAHSPGTEENHRRRVDTIIKQTVSSWQSYPPAENLAYLTEAERLVRELPGPDGVPGSDRLRLARVHYWLGRIYYTRSVTREAIEYFQQVLPVAQESGDAELLAVSSSAIGQAMAVQGYMGKAKALLDQAIPLFEQTGNWSEWSRAMGFHGTVVVAMGDYAAGVVEVQRALDRAREMNFLSEQALNCVHLSSAYLLGGDLPRAIEATREMIETAEQSGDRIFVYLGYGYRGWAEGRAGQFEAAADSMARAWAAAQELGGQVILADWFAAARAEIAFSAGHIDETITLAERAIGIAQKMGGLLGEGIARRAWGQALAVNAVSTPSRWEEAEAQLAESLRLLELGQQRLEAARTHVVWGSVCRNQGDPTRAREHWEKAAVQWEASSITWELEKTRALAK